MNVLSFAASALDLAVKSAPYFGAEVAASLSVGNFHENFDVNANELVNPTLKLELDAVVQSLAEAANRRAESAARAA